MTQDEIAALIPDNVVEAAAKERAERVGYDFFGFTKENQLYLLKDARASLAAGLAAWGGMDIDVDDPHLPPHFFLPIEEPKA